MINKEVWLNGKLVGIAKYDESKPLDENSPISVEITDKELHAQLVENANFGFSLRAVGPKKLD